MILILSTNGDDSTDAVIDWLNFFRQPFIRLNDNDHFQGVPATIYLDNASKKKQIILNLKEKELNIELITTVWFRKRGFFFNTNTSRTIRGRFSDYKGLLNGITAEYRSFLDLLINELHGKKWLTNPDVLRYTKLEILEKALRAGLLIPPTVITNTKSRLIEFMSRYNFVISKSLKDSFEVEYNRGSFDMFTHMITHDDVANLPDFFLPSLVQALIDKEFEIRVFYLLNKFYSMAIFSQNDEQTSVDFRVYNWQKPNRYVPYKLPRSVTIRLETLMQSINLNCGSIDLIKAKNGDFIFLEINPVGQFGFVSDACNYPLHKEVALSLISLGK